MEPAALQPAPPAPPFQPPEPDQPGFVSGLLSKFFAFPASIARHSSTLATKLGVNPLDQPDSSIEHLLLSIHNLKRTASELAPINPIALAEFRQNLAAAKTGNDHRHEFYLANQAQFDALERDIETYSFEDLVAQLVIVEGHGTRFIKKKSGRLAFLSHLFEHGPAGSAQRFAAKQVRRNAPHSLAHQLAEFLGHKLPELPPLEGAIAAPPQQRFPNPVAQTAYNLRNFIFKIRQHTPDGAIPDYAKWALGVFGTLADKLIGSGYLNDSTIGVVNQLAVGAGVVSAGVAEGMVEELADTLTPSSPVPGATNVENAAATMEQTAATLDAPPPPDDMRSPEVLCKVTDRKLKDFIEGTMIPNFIHKAVMFMIGEDTGRLQTIDDKIRSEIQIPPTDPRWEEQYKMKKQQMGWARAEALTFQFLWRKVSHLPPAARRKALFDKMKEIVDKSNVGWLKRRFIKSLLGLVDSRMGHFLTHLSKGGISEIRGWFARIRNHPLSEMNAAPFKWLNGCFNSMLNMFRDFATDRDAKGIDDFLVLAATLPENNGRRDVNSIYSSFTSFIVKNIPGFNWTSKVKGATQKMIDWVNHSGNQSVRIVKMMLIFPARLFMYFIQYAVTLPIQAITNLVMKAIIKSQLKKYGLAKHIALEIRKALYGDSKHNEYSIPVNTVIRELLALIRNALVKSQRTEQQGAPQKPFETVRPSISDCISSLLQVVELVPLGDSREAIRDALNGKLSTATRLIRRKVMPFASGALSKVLSILIRDLAKPQQHEPLFVKCIDVFEKMMTQGGGVLTHESREEVDRLQREIPLLRNEIIQRSVGKEIRDQLNKLVNALPLCVNRGFSELRDELTKPSPVAEHGNVNPRAKVGLLTKWIPKLGAPFQFNHGLLTTLHTLIKDLKTALERANISFTEINKGLKGRNSEITAALTTLSTHLVEAAEGVKTLHGKSCNAFHCRSLQTNLAKIKTIYPRLVQKCLETERKIREGQSVNISELENELGEMERAAGALKTTDSSDAVNQMVNKLLTSDLVLVRSAVKHLSRCDRVTRLFHAFRISQSTQHQVSELFERYDLSERARHLDEPLITALVKAKKSKLGHPSTAVATITGIAPEFDVLLSDASALAKTLRRADRGQFITDPHHPENHGLMTRLSSAANQEELKAWQDEWAQTETRFMAPDGHFRVDVHNSLTHYQARSASLVTEIDELLAQVNSDLTEIRNPASLNAQVQALKNILEQAQLATEGLADQPTRDDSVEELINDPFTTQVTSLVYKYLTGKIDGVQKLFQKEGFCTVLTLHTMRSISN
ncbi:MAG: hypothetical protein MRY21_07150 [Simkaniaceae bacterium]|nr:hypothetical protein [Simkaniaceae bacterium]